MNRHPYLRPLAIAAALASAAGVSHAASPSQAELISLIEKLNQRVERLEQRNVELERELRGTRTQSQAAGSDNVEKRLHALEQHRDSIEKGLESDKISENETELTSRLKAVESQTRTMQPTTKKLSALDGISAGFSLTTVAQRPSSSTGADSQLNYRADATVTLPLSNIGDIEHKLFAHVRLGQGGGLNDLPTLSRPNATAFRLDSLRPDDSVAVLGEAWYQADIPLPYGGFKPQSKEKLEITFGKMDPFVFFDQNAVAGDEARQFMNVIFVHNPLLDAGGDIGVDANGFSPGIRMSYVNATQKPQTWRVSMGVFGAGDKGSNYQRNLSSPLVLLQAETEQRLFGGLAGNYRAYAWSNHSASHFDTNVGEEDHSGWGISVDQRIGDGVTLFGRYGHQMQGHVSFDRALTLGAELNGSYWNRGGDVFGMAAGLLRTSQDYRDFAGISGNERVAELYYRYRISKQFELTPSYQFIGNPGGDTSADAIHILGLRAQLSY